MHGHLGTALFSHIVFSVLVDFNLGQPAGGRDGVAPRPPFAGGLHLMMRRREAYLWKATIRSVWSPHSVWNMGRCIVL